MALDWDKLRIFHAVAEAGSFTHAVETLGLSQSAVSRQISALEHAVKTPLFHRHARGLLLTEQGEILFKTTSDVAHRLAGVGAELLETREVPAGELKITATPGLGAVWLTRRLSAFTERYPDIQITLLLTDTDMDLVMRQADVAIRMHASLQPSLIQSKLFTAHFHVYAAREYLDKWGTPESVSDLDNHRLLVLGGTDSSQLNRITWLLKDDIEGARRQVREPHMTVNTLLALKFACDAGNGIAVLPDHIAEGSDNLVRLFNNKSVFELDTYLVYTEEMRHSRRLRVFRDFIVENTRHWPY